ncbi:MAG: LysM peptidoglycan-binding domain-containing protein [Acidobacteria bacterium]|nr:LysM peptidoglycan-binding domain-containing protein [Acidobacteriota bacterium]
MTASIATPYRSTNPLGDRRSTATAPIRRRTDLAFPRTSDHQGPATRRHTEIVYLRRRVVLGLVLAVVAVGLFVSIATISTAGADRTDGSPVFAGEPASYIVQPGDSLWSIAEELAPNADRRAVVDALADVSGGASLQPGQRIYLPGSLSGG